MPDLSGALAVDLSGVPFIDSATLAVLVELSRRVAPQGGRVVATGARRSAVRLLTINASTVRSRSGPGSTLTGTAAVTAHSRLGSFDEHNSGTQRERRQSHGRC
ncbi:MAG: STAS domain-containing protein [Acidimicrobiales bacterium]